MTARSIINGVDFVGREDVQFIENRVTSPSGERLAKQSFVVRESFREHVVPETRNDRYALGTTLRQIIIDVRMIQVLIDISHNYPIGNATTFFPADRKSTRLNSSHRTISYAVFCLKKKKKPI